MERGGNRVKAYLNGVFILRGDRQRATGSRGIESWSWMLHFILTFISVSFLTELTSSISLIIRDIALIFP